MNQSEAKSILIENMLSLIRTKVQEKVKALLKGANMWTEMDRNVEYLSCSKVETLGYFQLSDLRYDDRNEVTKKVLVQQSCFFVILVDG